VPKWQEANSLIELGRFGLNWHATDVHRGLEKEDVASK
jgi:hypothetical protein